MSEQSDTPEATSPAIAVLQRRFAELRAHTDFPTIAAKARHVAEMNQIDTAIHQLELCERHGILGRSDVYTFAPPPNDDLQYVVARGPKPERSGPWRAVEEGGQPLRPAPGDLLIRR